jgi:hypothetical protein
VPKTLSQKLIIKNIVVMNAVVLQQIAGLWKNIMRKKQLEMVLCVFAKSVHLS